MDPPGCIIALISCLAIKSIESLKGKNPSEAKTEFDKVFPVDNAFSIANLTAVTRSC